MVGFPLAATPPDLREAETARLVELAVQELDMVLQIGALIELDYRRVAAVVREVVQAAHPSRVLVKLILESGLLDQEQEVAACLLAGNCHVGFVKTSTGFGPAGATLEVARLMRSVARTGLGVKATGGIRSALLALAMVEAGATRLGTSSGAAIVEQALRRPAQGAPGY